MVNKLFYKNYTLNNLTYDDKCKIINTISDKYLDTPFLHKTTKIVDNHGKVILIEDVIFDFILSYIDTGSPFFSELGSAIEKKKMKTNGQVKNINNEFQNIL